MQKLKQQLALGKILCCLIKCVQGRSLRPFKQIFPFSVPIFYYADFHHSFELYFILCVPIFSCLFYLYFVLDAFEKSGNEMGKCVLDTLEKSGKEVGEMCVAEFGLSVVKHSHAVTPNT